MMKKLKVKRLGIGTGAGQYVEILAKEEILNILDNLDMQQVYKLALAGYNKGYKNGECQINLENGDLQTGSYSYGEHDQAIDSTYITIFTIDMNEEFPKEKYLTKEEIDNNKEVTEDIIIEAWEYNSVPLNYGMINDQLEQWYSID